MWIASMATSEAERLTNYWLWLLARRDYSRGELQKKAIDKGYDILVVSQCLVQFAQDNYINDLRLAQNLIDYHGKNRGPLWLRAKLAQRHISRETITEALQDYTPQVDAGFGHAMLQRYRVTQRDQVDQKMKARLYRYVASRGYMGAREIVETALEELEP
jgi:regulatory protein